MPAIQRLSCALAIGGLDPGGGAGILADARAMRRAGAFSTAVATVWTVQSTAGLERVSPVAPREIADSLLCVLSHQRVRAVKTGALGAVEAVHAVMRVLARYPRVPVVVDPVIRPTKRAANTGTRAGAGKGNAYALLLDVRALTALRQSVVSRATLVTPNADEACALTGIFVDSEESAVAAGRAIVALGARAVLVKGGHVPGPRVRDVLVVRDRVRTWTRPRISLPTIHGGGCTLAALVTGKLATRVSPNVTDDDIEGAVMWARVIHGRALANPADIGGSMKVLAL